MRQEIDLAKMTKRHAEASQKVSELEDLPPREQGTDFMHGPQVRTAIARVMRFSAPFQRPWTKLGLVVANL